MNYRIYKYVKEWELVGTVHNLDDVLGMLDIFVKNGINNFMVIEHDIQNICDFPIIYNIDDYLSYKEEYDKLDKKKYNYTR